MPLEWKEFSKEVIEKEHGRLYHYRKLYDGDHADIFPRAKDLERRGELITDLMTDDEAKQYTRTPYMIANISKLIPEIPAVLVARSIGNVKSSLFRKVEAAAAEPSTGPNVQDDDIDRATDDHISPEQHQQRILEQVEKNSNLQLEHWTNVVQHQVDGGIVGCAWYDERGPRIEFKQRDVWFPHEDGLGIDLVFEREIEGAWYIHVYRERVIDQGKNLEAKHLLYPKAGKDKEKLDEPLDDDAEIKRLLDITTVRKVYYGRTRPLQQYWANEKTFSSPLGRSVLKNTEALQEEINWTLTRTSIVYERNGKPRIAVTPAIYTRLEDEALDRMGYDPSVHERQPSVELDSRSLEIMEMDEQGRAMEVVQIDVTKIGDMDRVHDLMVEMLRQTRTATKAVDHSSGNGSSSAAQSGTAKFYDLITSVLKSQQLQKEYVYFLQQLFESVLWLMHDSKDDVEIEMPDIALNDMIPITRKELIDQNVQAYEKGAQSLETTVRHMNPQASEEWVHAEIARIESSKQSDDSTTLTRGRTALDDYLDNRNQPLVDEPEETTGEE